MRVAHDVMCTVHFFGVYFHPPKNCYSYYLSFNSKEKEEDLTQYYDKNPIPTENLKTNGQHKNATKNFDYTTITDRLRTVSCSNNNHPTGVVKWVYRYPTFPLTAKTHYKCLQFSLTALLLTLLTTYFRYNGRRYTLFVLTNQNHCYKPKLNDFIITQYEHM